MAPTGGRRPRSLGRSVRRQRAPPPPIDAIEPFGDAQHGRERPVDAIVQAQPVQRSSVDARRQAGEPRVRASRFGRAGDPSCGCRGWCSAPSSTGPAAGTRDTRVHERQRRPAEADFRQDQARPVRASRAPGRPWRLCARAPRRRRRPPWPTRPPRRRRAPPARPRGPAIPAAAGTGPRGSTPPRRRARSTASALPSPAAAIPRTAAVPTCPSQTPGTAARCVVDSAGGRLAARSKAENRAEPSSSNVVTVAIRRPASEKR